MNIEYEENFIDKFILKNKRSRIAFELANGKKEKMQSEDFIIIV